VSILADLEGDSTPSSSSLWSGAVIRIFKLVRSAELHEDALPVPRIGDARYTKVALEIGCRNQQSRKNSRR
jgi:hypothetical protein